MYVPLLASATVGFKYHTWKENSEADGTGVGKKRTTKSQVILTLEIPTVIREAPLEIPTDNQLIAIYVASLLLHN